MFCGHAEMFPRYDLIPAARVDNLRKLLGRDEGKVGVEGSLAFCAQLHSTALHGLPGRIEA